MPNVCRLIYTNLTQATPTAITASSEQSTFPASFIRQEISSKVWRSKLGWNVVAGRNDKIDFNDGSNKTATITAGNYATGADYATAVQTALNAVGSTFVVTYSTTTKKFTISHTGNFTLKWSTGGNTAQQTGKDLGYSVAADQSGAASYVAPNAAYKSREWVKFNLGSASSVQAAIAWRHNLGATDTVTVRGNASDAWSAPSFAQTLTGDTNKRSAYISQSYQWWEFLFEAQGNPADFTECGVLFLGPYTQTSVTYSVNFPKSWKELSQLAYATHGALYRDERPQRRVWGLQWSEVLVADRDLLESEIATVKVGNCFFMAFDAVDTPTDLFYGFRPDEAQVDYVAGNYWNVSMSFAEEVS